MGVSTRTERVRGRVGGEGERESGGEGERGRGRVGERESVGEGEDWAREAGQYEGCFAGFRVLGISSIIIVVFRRIFCHELRKFQK